MSKPPRRVVPPLGQANGNASVGVPPAGYPSLSPSSTSDPPPPPPSDPSEHPPTYLDDEIEQGDPPKDLSSDEALEQLLSGKPLSWGAVLAVRAALRVLPFIEGPDQILLRFRALAATRFAVGFASDLAFPGAVDAAEALMAERRRDAVSAAIYHAASNPYGSDERDAVLSLLNSTFDGPVFEAKAAFFEDHHLLVTNQITAEQLAIAKLWPEPAFAPASVCDAWRDLARNLGQDWRVWIDWYNHVVEASAPAGNERWETAFVDLPGPLPWDDGVGAVNTKIAARLNSIDDEIERESDRQLPEEDAPPHPSDWAAFERWLKTKSRSWLHVLAVRGVLRAVPLIAQSNEKYPDDLLLPLFRAMAISRFTVVYQSHGILSQRVHPADVASESARFAASTVAELQVLSSALSAAGLVAEGTASDSRRAAISLFCAALREMRGFHHAIDNAIQHDAQLLHEESLTPERLAAAELWFSDVPDDFLAYSTQLRSLGDHWGVWIPWYADVVVGRPRTKAQDAAYTDLPSPLPWNDGAEAVNLEIARRLASLDWPQTQELIGYPLPSQGPGPHFALETNDLIDRVPINEFDAQGNDLHRIRHLRPIVQRCAAELSQHLAGNKHPELERAVRSYEAAIAPADEADVQWGEVFGLGELLQNASDAARRRIKDRLLPELEDAAETALNTLLRLHGPMILASAEGRELATQADVFQMTRPDLESLERAAQSVAERLEDSSGIITPAAASDVVLAAHAIDKGRHPERGTIYGLAVLRNVSLVLIAGAVLSPPLLLGLVAGIPGAIAGGTLSLIGVEGLKRSKTFISIATQVSAKIDSMTGPELQAWIEKRARAAAPFRDFVLKNEEALRSIAQTTPQLRWMVDYIDIIRRTAHD
jgi:hypothetical protein